MIVMGVDLSTQEDFTAMSNEQARKIYETFKIPQCVMEKNKRDSDGQYQEFLKMNRIVIYKEGR